MALCCVIKNSTSLSRSAEALAAPDFIVSNKGNIMEELIKSFGWPHACFLLGIIFLIVFYGPIRDFIKKIKSISKEGLKTDVGPEIQKQDEKRKQATEELMNLDTSPLSSEVEKLIYSDLQRRNLETSGDTVKVLVRHMAATQLTLEFEQKYNLILGSQIYLLKKFIEQAKNRQKKTWG